MKEIILSFLVLLFSISGFAETKVRKVVDDVGFCTKSNQIETIIKLAKAAEKDGLKKEADFLKGKKIIAAISPHDDHMYAGRVYLYSIPYIAKAKTVVVFGVTHRKPRLALKDPKNFIILDDFDEWKSPYSNTKIDKKFRKFLSENLSKKHFFISNKAHSLEHSIEAMLAFLKYYNRDVKILPIMVTTMDFEHLDIISKELAGLMAKYIKENKLILGKDISFLISTDTTHYGPDFGDVRFGLDENAHKKGTEQDIYIGKTFLSGVITKEKLQGYANKVWKENIYWCGRYTVPFGVLTVSRVINSLTGEKIVGYPARYSDSYTTGILPAYGIGIGITAPFSLKHWVGYWSIVFYREK